MDRGVQWVTGHGVAELDTIEVTLDALKRDKTILIYDTIRNI